MKLKVDFEQRKNFKRALSVIAKVASKFLIPVQRNLKKFGPTESSRLTKSVKNCLILSYEPINFTVDEPAKILMLDFFK
jgi:hypothetical protein